MQGESIDDIPEAVIQDCVQLVKANSIQGQLIYNSRLAHLFSSFIIPY